MKIHSGHSRGRGAIKSGVSIFLQEVKNTLPHVGSQQNIVIIANVGHEQSPCMIGRTHKSVTF